MITKLTLIDRIRGLFIKERHINHHVNEAIKQGVPATNVDVVRYKNRKIIYVREQNGYQLTYIV